MFPANDKIALNMLKYAAHTACRCWRRTKAIRCHEGNPSEVHATSPVAEQKDLAGETLYIAEDRGPGRLGGIQGESSVPRVPQGESKFDGL